MHMPQRRLAPALLAAALALPAPAAPDGGFLDVAPDNWAAPAIEEMSNRKLMLGVGDGLFAPERPITAGEFIAILVRQFHPDQVLELTVPDNKWYLAYHACAQSNGYLDGLTTGMEEVLPRHDLAMLLYNVAKDQDMELSAAKSGDIPDFASIPEKKRDAVLHCYGSGLLAGVDEFHTFAPQQSMTRAQAAVVMSRLLNWNTPGPAINLPEPLEAPPAQTECQVSRVITQRLGRADGIFTHGGRRW